MDSDSETNSWDSHSVNISAARVRPKGRKRLIKQDLTVYWLLAALRIILTLVPQTGYIHPDEYFQTIEIVAGDIFDLDIQRPWEFNVTFPVRSILLPKLVYGIPYIILDTFSPDLNKILGWDVRTPYIMLLLPRIVACFLSFVTDYCLYKICILYGQKYRSRLLILGSSYVLIVYGTRTFTNSIEMALTSLLLYLVADSMLLSEKVLCQLEFLNAKYVSASSPTERVKLYKMRATLPSHSLRHCFLIASVCVAGVFNRPTFLAFGFPPVVFWLQRGICSKSSGLKGFHIRIFIFILYALPSLLLFILVDSLYYGHLTWNEVGMADIGLNNFVVTPFNFLLYNSRESNLAQHGLHPRVTHMLVNIPILYNVLGLTGFVAVYNLLVRASQAKWHQLPRIQSIMMLMTSSILVPVIALSLIPHQEARFLIPLTLPLVFLYAQDIRDMDSPPPLMYHKQESIQSSKQHTTRPSRKGKRGKGKSLINLWFLLNFLLAMFFGFLHQGGVYPLMSYMKEILQKQTKFQVVHLVTSHLYSIPHSLLVQRNSERQYFDPKTKTRFLITRKFFSHELGTTPMSDVVTHLKEIIRESDSRLKTEGMNYQVYLAIPSSILEELLLVVGSNLTMRTEGVFYPHLSTEAMPRLKKWKRSDHLQQPICLDDHPEPDKSDFSFSEFEAVDEQICVQRETVETSETSIVEQIYDVVYQFGLVLLRVES